MKNSTAMFIGHRDCYGVNESAIRDYIITLINGGITDFLCGGMGNFDWMCAKMVYDLKKEYKYIRCFLVIPYLTFNIKERIYFDDVIYPEGLEKYHFKSAILARNKYMIENSSHAVCFVSYTFGGAIQTYKKAVKEGLIIKNFGSLPASL